MHRALFGVSRLLPCTSSFRKVLGLTPDRTVRRTNVGAKQTSATWGPAPGESARRGASLCPPGPENLVWPPLPAGVPWVQGAAGGASWAQCRDSELLWGRLTFWRQKLGPRVGAAAQELPVLCRSVSPRLTSVFCLRDQKNCIFVKTFKIPFPPPTPASRNLVFSRFAQEPGRTTGGRPASLGIPGPVVPWGGHRGWNAGGLSIQCLWATLFPMSAGAGLCSLTYLLGLGFSDSRAGGQVHKRPGEQDERGAPGRPIRGGCWREGAGGL